MLHTAQMAREHSLGWAPAPPGPGLLPLIIVPGEDTERRLDPRGDAAEGGAPHPAGPERLCRPRSPVLISSAQGPEAEPICADAQSSAGSETGPCAVKLPTVSDDKFH